MLPISEKIGLSLELTQWVLNTAFRQHKQWPGKDYPNIAINLSAKVVDSPELLNIVKSSLKIWDMDPGRVTLEVTESAIIDDKIVSLLCQYISILHRLLLTRLSLSSLRQQDIHVK